MPIQLDNNAAARTLCGCGVGERQSRQQGKPKAQEHGSHPLHHFPSCAVASVESGTSSQKYFTSSVVFNVRTASTIEGGTGNESEGGIPGGTGNESEGGIDGAMPHEATA
ncbi:hypothetical protein [Candidatus Palauibacter sp.]|uniref:hypothetical protein n=1 Tax=Candidatus Palauibacter sp. TaxID=3101350 RepID=UPI003B01D7CB